MGGTKFILDAYFQKVEIRILERLENEFRAAHSRIRPEFLTGDETVDSVGLIQVIAEVKK